MLHRLKLSTMALVLCATTLTTPLASSSEYLPPVYKLMSDIKTDAPALDMLLKKLTPKIHEHAKHNSSLHHGFFTKAWRTTSITIRSFIVGALFTACCAYAMSLVKDGATIVGGGLGVAYCACLWFLGLLAGWQSSFGSKLAAKPSDLNMPLLKTYFYPALITVILGIIMAQTNANLLTKIMTPVLTLTLTTIYFSLKLIFGTAPNARKELEKQRNKAMRIIYDHLLAHPELKNNQSIKQLLAHF